MDSGEAAGLLHLFCDKHVTYHRVYRAEEAGLPDPDVHAHFSAHVRKTTEPQ